MLIGKTLYGYDNYNAMAGMETYGGTAAPPGHLSSYDATVTTRGNLTGVTSYTDVGAGASVTHSNKLDIFGDVTKAQVDCCNQKSFTMTQGTYWSRPAQTTSGDTSGIYLTSSASYDFNSLVAISQTNPDNQTTTYSYDAQQNPTGFTSPTGANSTTAYNVFGERTSSTVNYNDGATNKSISTSSVYDAWGQMTSSVEANGAQTNYTYDNMGHRLTQTNPFPQGGTPGPVTSYQYDQLGRVTQVTLQDGNTAQTSYSGSVVTVTDQVNRKIKRESDGLRRLIKVTEQDVSTGTLTQETTYTYDVSDRLTGVTQGSQTRAFKYDSEGHLLFERIPEMPAMVNDGTGTMWSTKYTYTSFGAVATKTDGRGVIITYGYDTLNRLTSISYNTTGAPNVVATPNVTYTYDTNQSSSTNGLLLSLNTGGYSESYSYDSFKRVQSVTRTIDGRNYTSSYQYNTANQMTQMTYPSGRVINLGHDSIGRITSVGSYLTGVTYNNIGQLTGTSLGNGVNESYGYDSNRMQLTSQVATKSGGPTGGLMNLTYNYQASAGQMGAGATAGNAGQLTSISGTIGGAAESTAYSYDDLGRLVTSNQTSNGSSAQRRFAYDRWGNRTGMWDAVSGGNQLQNIVIDGANHIWSVNASDSNPNYYYDPAGNLVWAAGHSYNYDAENRMVCLDGCATGQYSYDPSNRRYKKVTGGVTTHYIWQGSHVISEYDGSSGAVTAEYVYSGRRMIAKIAGGATQYFLRDRLSTRLVLDTSGNVLGRQGHLPFGEDFGESGSQEKRHFTGYQRDAESGSDYAVNRQFAPQIGRFMRPDPSVANIRQTAPQSWNIYNYTRNEPVDQTDPLGLFDNNPDFCPPEIENCDDPGLLNYGVFGNVFGAPDVGEGEEQNDTVQEPADQPPEHNCEPDWDYAVVRRDRTLSANGFQFIRSWEAFSATLYNDAGGNCTIGYGHLLHMGPCNASDRVLYPNGITRPQADGILRTDVAVFENAVNGSVNVPLMQYQFDALVSFSFNIGAGNFRASTLLRQLNQLNYNIVPTEMLRWNRSGGRVMRGLTRRREAEGNMFCP